MFNIKDYFAQKRKIISIVVVFTILLTVVFSSVSYKAAEKVGKLGKKELKVLAINPGSNVSINSKSTTVNYKGENKSIDINVTNVSMPQFIGQVDQLNGKYDVVVVTRTPIIISNPEYYNSEGDLYNPSLEKDYSNPFTPYNMFNTNTSIDKVGVPIPEGYKNAFDLSEDSDPYRIRNGKKTTNIYGERTYVEYYSENDITNKRAEEIKSMIDSGQLVIFDEKIFSGDIDNTKLFTNFSSYRDKGIDNFIVKSRNDITVDNIAKYYFDDNIVENQSVKPIIEVKSPSILNDTSYYTTRDLNFEFNVKTGDAVEDGKKVKVDIYLDFNGDTLFKGTDLIYTTYLTITNGEASCKYDYKVTDEFIGQLDWKIEVSTFDNDYIINKDVESNTKTKAYEVGKKIFISNETKKKIKVLQITPNNDSLLNLDNDSRMQNFLSGNNNSLLNSYDISIDRKTIKEVNELNEIDDSYTMIIFGFADTYGGSSDLSEEMVEKVKNFAKEGNSIMFTHDTMPINIESAGKGSVTGPKILGENFRDYIGQSRYKDVNRDGEESNIYPSFSAEYDDEGKFVKFNKDETNNIPHDDIDIHSELRNEIGDTTVYSYGYTDPILMRVRRNNGFKGNKDENEGELYNQPYMVLNTAVDELNEGSITSYPYNLPNNMSVARTHNQWYQLNLEDEDVVPWYTLDPNKVAENTVSLNNGGAAENLFKSYDARNYYYTYSKGNITYSGTGHSNDFTDDELKLFVNTIIKADRSCNHPPTLEAKKKEGDQLLDLKDNMETSRGEDLTLNITPNDIDLGDAINVDIEAYVGNDDNWKKVQLDNCNFSKKSGETFDFIISKSNYENKDINKIKVVINGSDGKADAEIIEKTFTIVEDNSAPIIEAKKVEDDEEKDLIDGMYTKRKEDLSLVITPDDPDIDDIITVNVVVEKYSKSENSWSVIELVNSEFKKKPREKFNFSVSKDNYRDEDISKLRITIKGKDNNDCESNTIVNTFNIVNLEHGLFDEYSFDHPNEGEAIRKNVSLVGGTYGTFGVSYTYRSSDDEIVIEVDNRITGINNINAYKIDNSTLNKVTIVQQNIQGNNIVLRINDSNVSEGDTVLIKYSGYIPNYNGENVVLTNTAKINGTNIVDNAKVTIVKQPDLY